MISCITPDIFDTLSTNHRHLQNKKYKIQNRIPSSSSEIKKYKMQKIQNVFYFVFI